METLENKKSKFSFGMFLVTIGIVYGDIGTSPLYVMKSIMEGNGGIGEINRDFIIGSLSLVIWTITLLTTVKCVFIAMKADNHGEGGIFALYSLVKRCGKWLIVPAMLGGASLLADGVLTPAVTITTAVEGLRSISFFDRMLGEGQVKVVLITLAIIAVLFLAQRAGTSKIGKAFGPVMLLWFSFLGAVGLVYVFKAPYILASFNPIYAVKLLISPYNKLGFMVLGSVFLAATGAEALYSDMGHVGRENIYFSWPFVKICLILNYLGQGAWIIANEGSSEIMAMADPNPFYLMLPTSLRPVAIILAAAAAVIASQALITGSYTLVSEATHLDLMPHLKTLYPSDTKGQIYIPTVNMVLWIGCSFVVLYFRSGSRIESAYGLAITVTMLMTNLLLFVYLWKIKNQKLLGLFVITFLTAIEAVFFISSLSKFVQGGYFTVILALIIFAIMYIWYRGTQIEKTQSVILQFRDYIPNLKALHDDESIAPVADNLVMIETNASRERVDRDVLYSILDKDPKRAKAYFFISVNVVDDPDSMEYAVLTYDTDFIFRIKLFLGFKVQQSINVYLRQIIDDLMQSGELPPQTKKFSIYGDESKVGTFKLVTLRRVISDSAGFSSMDMVVLKLKYAIRKLAGYREHWYGMDSFSKIEETVPLSSADGVKVGKLTRVDRHKKDGSENMYHV